MHVFVAGATGAIGRQLVPALIAAGHQVTGTSRTQAGVDQLEAQGATGVLLDVFDAAAVKRAVADAAPDAIIHQLTALNGGDPTANSRIRRVGTRHLVDAAHDAGVRRIVAQSVAWAYAPGDDPADESTPLDYDAPAPRDRLISGVDALERTVAEIEHPVVLRYGQLYGPGTWYRPDGLAARVLRGADDPDAVYLGDLTANDAVSSFVHVDDAAAAAVAALQWPDGPVNVVDDEPTPAHEWLSTLAAAVDAPAPLRAAGRAGWERGATNALARSRGWTPEHSWRTGFGETTP
jgi:nucleoside-diphosphate-sugar epimerase